MLISQLFSQRKSLLLVLFHNSPPSTVGPLGPLSFPRFLISPLKFRRSPSRRPPTLRLFCPENIFSFRNFLGSLTSYSSHLGGCFYLEALAVVPFGCVVCRNAFFSKFRPNPCSVFLFPLVLFPFFLPLCLEFCITHDFQFS